MKSLLAHRFRLVLSIQSIRIAGILACLALVTLCRWQMPVPAYADGPTFDVFYSFGGPDTTESVVLGDLNGDGTLDIIVGNHGEPNLVYLNDGAGSFPTGSPFGGPDATTSVAVGDLNGDGVLDIVVGIYGGPNLVYLNDGLGGFPSGRPFGDPDVTTSVAVGDLNGDGALDIVVGIYSGPNLVYLNDGLGNFDSGSPFGSDYTTDVAAGDLDGDGDLDLVVGRAYQPNLVYLNDGSGDFSLGSPFGDSDDLTNSVTLGDLDRDGDLDLIAGNGYKGDERQSLVYLNDGAGNFPTGNPFDFADSTHDVALGDLDGDGDLDLAVGNNVSFDAIYLNNGAGGFSLDSLPGAGDVTTSLVLGDLDRDGDLDLVVGRSFQPNLIYLNNQVSNLSSGDSFSDPGAGWDVEVGDLDGDGAFDLVVGDVVFLNDGSGNFPSGNRFDTSIYLESLVLGDLNGDGALDIVVGNRDELNLVYLNDGAGNFDSGSPFGDPDNTRSLALGDLDGDGDLDVVVGNGYIGEDHQNLVYLNDGLGGFPSGRPLGDPDATTSVAVGDLNGDGSLDIVVGNTGTFGGEPSLVYLNDGTGNFPSSSPFGWGYPTAVAVGDLNGDGALDIIVGNGFWGKENPVYWNDGAGNFSIGTPLGGMAQTIGVAMGDLNGDGALDIVVANASSGEDPHNLVYLNDGLGGFPSAVPFGSTDAGGRVAVGDLDGDGDLDVILGGAGEMQVFWNTRQGGQALPNNAPSLMVTAPYTASANFYAIPAILDDFTIPIAYTLFDPELDPVGRVEALYSLDGGGHWLPAVATTGTITTNLSSGFSNQITPSLGLSDGDAISVTLAFSDTGSIVDLVVGLTIVHTQSRQLAAALHSPCPAPTGTHVLLFDGVGGNRAGFANLTLSDRASRPITGVTDIGTTAVLGTYRPVQPLSRLGGAPLDMPLTLVITDGLAIDGLVGYWKFDEGSGTTANDGSGFGNDGTLTNGPFYTITTPITIPFNNPYALAFDGVDDYIAANGAADDITTEVTIAFWVKALPYSTSEPSDQDALVAVNTSSGGNVLLLTTDGSDKLRVFDGGSGAYEILSVAPIADDTWHHIAYVSDGIAGSVYIDGVFESSHTVDYVFAASDQWSIGQEFDAATHIDFFEGIIDDVRLYNRALPGTEIARLAHGQTGTLERWSLKSIGSEHTYTWDTFRSDLFGQSDNVVFRLVAYPQLAQSSITGTHRYLNSTPGPYQRPYASAQTFPFRVRGTQVRVYSETVETGNEVAGAIVYRLPEGRLTGGFPLADSSGIPLRTNHRGYLQGRGETGLGDQLLALTPITWTESYTLYHTSGTPTAIGLDAYTVTVAGVQTLTISANNPLILFNLDISLEWDAHNDIVFMEKLQYDLLRAAEHLYDFSDGQATLGEVYVFHDAENWQTAHMRVYANNRLRPNAVLGGVISGTITDTLVPTITYEAGQIRMPATWNRYGDPGGSIGEDWPRTLAHEFGHYYLFLDDHYLGLDENGQVINVDTCTDTAMTDPYRYSEYRDQDGWLPACADTMANHLTGRSDWATIELFYSELSGSDTRGYNDGPALMPFNFTEITIFDPLTPTQTLADPTFYFLTEGGQRYQPAVGTRGFLLKDDTWLLDVGEPVIDHILARGAKTGDRLCVFDAASSRLGCEDIRTGDDQVILYSFPDWRPEIVVSPVTTNSIAVTVHTADSLSLQGRIFSIDGPATEIFDFTETGSGTYTTTITSTNVLLLEGFVQIWVSEAAPRREMITDYSIGASPGMARGHGGMARGHGGMARGHGGMARGHGGMARGHGTPILSGDGQVTIYTPDPTLPDGEFLTIQVATGISELPPGRVQIGQAYRIAATAGITNLNEGSISFQYLGEAVPAGMEEDITIYYWDENEASWHALPTMLNTLDNFASAQIPGSGLYALLTAFRIPLYAPGWNMFSYPLRNSQPVTEALISISGYYTTVYGYEATDTGDPWKVYDVTASDYVNDLAMLEFGRGYWINVSQAITMYIGATGGESTLSAASLPPHVPATYYGEILAGEGFTPAPGETVTAWVGDSLCGQGETLEVDGQVVYAINVLAEEGGPPGCGAAGRMVAFQVGSQMMIPMVAWDDTRLWEVPLSGSTEPFRVYLPLILKGD